MKVRPGDVLRAVTTKVGAFHVCLEGDVFAIIGINDENDVRLLNLSMMRRTGVPVHVTVPVCILEECFAATTCLEVEA